jgi:putative glycosyltransferase (TIGR04372 family)
MYRRKIYLVDERHPHVQRELYGLFEYLKSKESPIARPIESLNSIPHIRNVWSDPRRLKEWTHGRTVLEFTSEELAQGAELLSKMGIPAGAPFACFGVRENSYYENAWTRKPSRVFPWTSVIPQESRPQNVEPDRNQFRNMQSVMGVNLANYAAAIRHGAEAGLYMLRIGTDVEQELPVDLGSKVINYAQEYRTEFGDIFLTAHCAFMLSGSTGNYAICHAFKRPVVVTDVYLASTGCLSSNPDIPNLFVPRLYWYAQEKRFLTFGEIFQCARRYQHASNCTADGIEVIANEPDDIRDAVAEVMQRIDRTWQDLAEDADLQRRFMALYEPYHEGYGSNGRVPAAFLRKHRDLLR